MNEPIEKAILVEIISQLRIEYVESKEEVVSPGIEPGSRV